MVINSQLLERAGIVYEILNPTELIMDCSCWLCSEYATVHFKRPHGLELKPGDWIRVWTAGEIYNYERVSRVTDTYVWEVDAERIERTSRFEEICRLEECGETDCGWYETLIHEEYPDIEKGLLADDLLRALKAHRESLIARGRAKEPPEQMRLPL